VDAGSRKDVAVLIRDVAKRLGKDVVWVSHYSEALEVAERVVELGAMRWRFRSLNGEEGSTGRARKGNFPLRRT
jgi:ABC-type lipoprotein export system ATPase subunit